MFYFFLAPILVYNWILILAAIIPAVILLITVYRSDRLEAESPSLLRTLVIYGVLSTLIAMILERIGGAILGAAVSRSDPLYNIILYFIIVGFAEEGAKYFMLRRRTWRSPEYNCQYDSVVYAVFVSLGFALWENISYVLHYGFATALVRAVTAIPGHACFGVFMGVFYGLAKGSSSIGDSSKARAFNILAVIIPALVHGAYDYIASMQDAGTGIWKFVIFVALLFLVSFALVNHLSKNDKYFRYRRDFYRNR
ncbi:MAG: PrsW family intramembrane metalloprotease [Lachnospiraceae bacterium]|nr:PrsW family intramembrane metalloprotease [Parasporobacterium sp.]MBR3397820.1 PrsW family intramembrane metalloprotease [Lachnospiraceae bacterium]